LIIVLFVRHQHGNRGTVSPQVLTVAVATNNRSNPGPVQLPESAARRGCAVAAQRSGKAATDYPSYLRTAQVADLLYVSPKTVSRWAKEGKLPFPEDARRPPSLPGGRDPRLAEELREEAVT
jgi:excisionase family DNA binding protein